MAYFCYSPEDTAQSTPARIELVSDTEADRQAILALLASAMPAVMTWEPDTDREKLFADLKAIGDKTWEHAQGLPYESTLELLEKLSLDQEVDILDAKTGLGMMALGGKFKFITEEIGSAGFFVTDITDDPEVQRQAAAGRFNYLAYQREISNRSGEELPEHHSLGYGTDDGDYQPMVTVFSQDYLAHRAAEIHRLQSGDDAAA